MKEVTVATALDKEGGKKTLKISQAQWEFIGKKAGWLVRESGMGGGVMEWIKKLPGFNEAMLWFEKLKGNVVSVDDVIKKLNITQKEIDLAEKIVRNGGIRASDELKMVKGAGLTNYIDVRVILIVIVIFLGVGMFNAIKSGVKSIADQRQNYIDNVVK